MIFKHERIRKLKSQESEQLGLVLALGLVPYYTLPSSRNQAAEMVKVSDLVSECPCFNH